MSNLSPDKKSLVSVIIPTYNAASTILETIDSVLKQTYQNLEIIIINDGSTDSTLSILESLSNPSIKIITKENGGVASARNLGIELATGDFISFLDADDLWAPEKVSAQLDALSKHPEAKAVYSWNQFFTSEKDLTGSKKVLFSGNVFDQLILGNFIGNGSNIMMSNKEMKEVGLFNPEFSPCEDWEYFLRFAEKYEFAVSPHFHVHYRLSPHSASADLSKMKLKTFNLLKQFYQASTLPKEKIYASNWLSLAHMSLDKSSRAEALIQALQFYINAVSEYWPYLFTHSFGRRMPLKIFKKLILSVFEKAPAYGNSFYYYQF